MTREGKNPKTDVERLKGTVDFCSLEMSFQPFQKEGTDIWYR